MASLQHAHHWSKAGVMMRDTLNANARHAFLLVSGERGVAFQRRTATGGLSSHTDDGSGRAPGWVRLTRRGSTFRAYRSGDGVNWTLVGSQSIAMGRTIHVGLAVSSHASQLRAAAVFDRVTVTPVTSTGSTSTSGSMSTTTASRALRVLHWNIQHGRLENGTYNITLQADWIARFKPDVVSLNEVHHSRRGTATRIRQSGSPKC